MPKLSDPLVQFVLDQMAERGMEAVRGKETVYNLSKAGLCSDTLRNWKRGANPRLENFLLALASIGYGVEIVPK